MADVLDVEIIDAMTRFGGSYVSALGRAFQRADPDNFARLKAAFPEYWKEYRGIAMNAKYSKATNDAK